jgi:hypothetical protein
LASPSQMAGTIVFARAAEAANARDRTTELNSHYHSC